MASELAEQSVVAADEAAPVCFIEHVDGEFRVTDEAKEMFANVRGKVVIVCVAGPYRTGKSFLLNKLLGHPSGFKVGATVRACTKGIWVWGKPIVRDEMSYLFLDTEGLGSTDQALAYDTKIFSLAVLLSSFFILNTQGTINEQALNELELVVNCAKQIRVYDNKSEEEIVPSSHLANVFPSFLWVLRDFVLRLTDEDNKPMSASDYLESCLSQKSNSRTKNRTREAIKSVFVQRDCRTLVRPVLDEEQLQSLDSVPSIQLRPEFVKQLDSLSALIFASARPKQINGGFVNGPALLGLAEAYTEAMNGGKMPVIYTAWEAVVMSQATQAMESAINAFDSRVKCFCPDQTVVEREVLDEAFLEAEKAAIQVLRNVCVGDEDANRATESELFVKLTEMKREKVAENINLSRIHCQQVLEEIWTSDKQINENEFTQTVACAREKYYERAIGPCKEEVCRVFFEKKLLLFCDSLAEKIGQLTTEVAQLQTEKSELSELHAEATKTMEEQNETIERVERELESLKQEHSTLLAHSQATELQLQQQVSELKQEKEDLTTQLQKLRNTLAETEQTKQRATTKHQKIKERLLTLTTELQNEREKSLSLSHSHQSLSLEQQQHKQQIEAMEASCRAVTAEGLKQQTLASAAHSQERLQLSTSLEAQVSLAQQQHDQLTKLQTQVTRLEAEKTQREEALKLKRLQKSSGSWFPESDTLASLFFCLFVIVLSARFGFGPSWLT